MSAVCAARGVAVTVRQPQDADTWGRPSLCPWATPDTHAPLSRASPRLPGKHRSDPEGLESVAGSGFRSPGNNPRTPAALPAPGLRTRRQARLPCPRPAHAVLASWTSDPDSCSLT